MENLDKLRNSIDDIDKELIDLFEKRMEIVLSIAKYKIDNNIPVLNQDRENDILNKCRDYIKNKEFEKISLQFLSNIMNISKGIQTEEIKKINTEDKQKNENIIVGFQGVQGSFSQEALIKHFGDEVKTKNLSEFEDVFKALQNCEIDYGVLPIENSSTGSICEIYDLLYKYGFYIVGEECIKIEQNLLGLKGTTVEDIKEVYSHIQGFKQSREFLNEYREWDLIEHKNTATSAKLVKECNSKEKAAIGSKKAAKLYDLSIIEPNINFSENNYTRFIIVGKNMEIDDTCNKISIVVSVSHKPGSLYKVLKHFADNNLNMLKIESRPIANRSWEYFFYIDFEGNINDNKVLSSINDIKIDSNYFRNLGNYKY